MLSRFLFFSSYAYVIWKKPDPLKQQLLDATTQLKRKYDGF